MRSMTTIGQSATRPECCPWRDRVRGLGVLTLTMLAFGGCGDLQPAAIFEPETDGFNLFGSITLDHRAVNLTTASPHDAIQLTATPRNLHGEPMQGLPAPTYRSTDTVSVAVAPDGRVQARRATSGVRVIAELVTADNIRHADTAYVRVTSNGTPPDLASLEITPASPEAAEWPMSTGDFGGVSSVYFSIAGMPSPAARAISAIARDGAGNPVSGLEIDYISLNPNKALVNRRTGAVEKVVGPPGEQVPVVARTTAFGVTRADTATVTLVGPVLHAFLILDLSGVRTWSHTEVVIRPGGVVSWYYATNGGTPLDITLADTTGVETVTELCTALGAAMPHFCETGDTIRIPGTATVAYYRRFNDAGVYEFETNDGIQGRVRVVEDDDPMWDGARSGQ